LRAALAAVAGEERGLVIYSRGQEGRGIGLMRKLEAYALQDEGLDTVEANESMGFVADAREYSAAAAVLADLGVQSIRLLTNNPAKRLGLEASGTVVAELVPLVVAGTDESRAYLATKVAKLGHVMEAGDVASPSEGTEDA
jgi:3,4-dihydroxy 2-butanone 4-phosphate synthase/GTP cyclohydrolase II